MGRTSTTGIGSRIRNAVAFATMGFGLASIAAVAPAAVVRLEIQNLMPAPGGGVITPLYFAFHDGSFDTFSAGQPASSALQAIAEDALTGTEGTVPGLLEELAGFNLEPDQLPPSESLMAARFATSPAAANGGIQGLLTQTAVGIVPGQTLSTTLDVDPADNAFLSYAAMFIPSNDAFLADLAPVQVFDPNGDFIGAEILILGSDIWDAGTEVNDETLANVPLQPSSIGRGTAEGGVISAHPGLGNALTLPLPGVTTGPAFPLADFSLPGYQVARITVSEVEVPEPLTLGLLFAAGLPVFLVRRSRRA